MTAITVAALQLALGSEDEATNIAAVSALVEEAAAQGAQLILPPELFSGPYFCREEDEALFALARPTAEHPSVIAMQALGCSSLYGFTEFKQDNSFLIVAERTNANGSRKFKRLLDEEQWDQLVGMAREEMRDGSHLIDLCVDFVGRDGVKDIGEVASRIVRQVNAPLMLDSTEAPVLEEGLKRAGGRCIVNSINLEGGEERMNRVCPLLKRYGAADWFLIGDLDFATHIRRSEILKEGGTLTDATAALARGLDIRAAILPMCDEPVMSMVTTPVGELPFQEYFVRRRHQDAQAQGCGQRERRQGREHAHGGELHDSRRRQQGLRTRGP